jgi:hypothetical protein
MVYVEWLNGVLRDRLNALTRKTHALAKGPCMWDALVTLRLFEHNWMRAHLALREKGEGLPGYRKYQQKSPAMAMGSTDHIWTWEEFLTYRVNHYQAKWLPDPLTQWHGLHEKGLHQIGNC